MGELHLLERDLGLDGGGGWVAAAAEQLVVSLERRLRAEVEMDAIDAAAGR